MHEVIAIISLYRSVIWASITSDEAIVVAIRSMATVSEDEQKRDENDNLVDSLTDNVTEHHRCEYGLFTVVWLLIKQIIIGSLGGEGHSSKGVHQDVDPKEWKGA